MSSNNARFVPWEGFPSGLRVLVVEPELSDLESTRKALEELNYRGELSKGVEVWLLVVPEPSVRV